MGHFVVTAVTLLYKKVTTFTHLKAAYPAPVSDASISTVSCRSQSECSRRISREVLLFAPD
jgi:hypothetical protein